VPIDAGREAAQAGTGGPHHDRAERQPARPGAKLAHQPRQSRRRVRNLPIVPHRTPQAAFRYRHDDPVLVNIKPDIRDTRVLCMGLGAADPAQPSLPAYREMGRPVFRRTCGLEYAVSGFLGLFSNPLGGQSKDV
jgi:hypothetical protein